MFLDFLYQPGVVSLTIVYLAAFCLTVRTLIKLEIKRMEKEREDRIKFTKDELRWFRRLVKGQPKDP